MTQQQYEKWSYVFRKEEKRIRFLNRADRMITACVFLSYPGLLLYLFGTKRFFELFFCAAIPAVSFAAVSSFRAVYSAKRPYEVLDIQPLIKKETEGKSFPSRHVFSVFIIGMSFFYIAEPMGIAAFVSGTALAYLRVVGGVHFPKDVAAGALFGILCGLPYLFL
ncbi:MAG: phosphatase PAP2 family protein [Eubacterium sp.]|nr:phosphatase PAP2 family protein [Eubacterium sp.]